MALTQVGLSQTTIFSDDFSTYSTDAALLATWTRASGTSVNIGLAVDPDSSGTHGQNIFRTPGGSNLGQLTKTLSSGLVPTDLNPIVFSFDLYDPNGGTTSGRDYAEIRFSGSTQGLFDAGIYNSVNTGTLAQGKYQARDIDNGLWIQLDTVRTVGWHNFEFTIRATTVDLKIDGTIDPQFNNRAWNGFTGTSKFDLIKIGSALSSNLGTANYDNVFVGIAVVPEPSTATLMLLGLGFTGLLIRRRTK